MDQLKRISIFACVGAIALVFNLGLWNSHSFPDGTAIISQAQHITRTFSTARPPTTVALPLLQPVEETIQPQLTAPQPSSETSPTRDATTLIMLTGWALTVTSGLALFALSVNRVI